MKTDKCVSCDSHNVKPVNISYNYLGNIVENVPVIQCLDCGEEIVLSTVLSKVSKLIKDGKTCYHEGPVLNIRYQGSLNREAQ